MLDRLLSFHEVERKHEGTGDISTISAESILITGESNWIQSLLRVKRRKERVCLVFWVEPD
jgi:hypothetical protein